MHKGERIDPADYFWPEEFGPATGLQYEARGLKWTARGNPVEHLVNGGKPGPQDLARLYRQYDINVPPTEADPIRQQRLARLLPSWR